MRPFAELAQSRAPTLDRLALAIAAEFREVDERAALARLAELADELVAGGAPVEEGDALAALLGGRYGFAGNEASYDHPDNSMLNLVLERGAGLPILLSVVYEEVARRRWDPAPRRRSAGTLRGRPFRRGPPARLRPVRRRRADRPRQAARPRWCVAAAGDGTADPEQPCLVVLQGELMKGDPRRRVTARAAARGRHVRGARDGVALLQGAPQLACARARPDHGRGRVPRLPRRR
jgi:hypothetical protein